MNFCTICGDPLNTSNGFCPLCSMFSRVAKDEPVSVHVPPDGLKLTSPFGTLDISGDYRTVHILGEK
ncbi:MAG TPA: hypothetical protein VEH04_16870 [Verrucomicrobiae bacterium]|nr:hypothetical protein [Verrucomicrobiae bacterium]